MSSFEHMDKKITVTYEGGVAQSLGRSLGRSTVGKPTTSRGWAACYQDCRVDLIRFISRKVSCNEDAAEIAQDTYLAVSKVDLSTVKNPRAYIFKSAANLTIDFIRARDTRRRNESKVAQLSEIRAEVDRYASANEVESGIEVKEILESLNKALSHVSPKCKKAFLLHRVQNKTYREIAKEMNITTSMVEKHISNALHACRVELDKFR
jgi:RNA polymerase sigma-70 factor (ECF subfamily)